MMLVLNCGSQSVKWKIFDGLKVAKEGKREIFDKNDFENVLSAELEKIKEFKIEKTGHRVVHSGGFFEAPVKIADEVLEKLEKSSSLAPLHNPYNILGIKACQKAFADIPQFAVFDTSFFANLPEKASTYALPEKISAKFNFKRFGFHGISHEYVSKKAAEIAKKPFRGLKIITCHLGGGVSVAAIRGGKPVDISMGFTPMEGVVMMTRSGNVDAGIVLKLAKEFGVEKAEEILNRESGVRGICGEGEMIKVLAFGGKKAKLALDVFVYSVQKYIGAYSAILQGCDILVFTGAIGAGSSKIRNMICKDLKILNKTKIMAIETDEELAIAQKISKL